MTKKPTKYPLESFGPELMAALVEGSRKKIVLKFEGANGVGKRLAHGFHRRIHTLRARMRDLDHPDYTIASKALVSIFWGDRAVEEGEGKVPASWSSDVSGHRGAIIVIKPRDSEFESVLREAGIGVTHDALPPKPYVGATITSADEEASLDQFVEELASKQDHHEEEPH